jgi:hypothetical protein
MECPRGPGRLTKGNRTAFRRGRCMRDMRALMTRQKKKLFDDWPACLVYPLNGEIRQRLMHHHDDEF